MYYKSINILIVSKHPKSDPHHGISLEPNEARPGGQNGVLRDNLQICTTLGPLQHNDTSIPSDTASDQELALVTAEFHTTNLVQTSVDVLDELQLGLDLEDGNGVTARVEDGTSVTVRDVNEGLGELRRSFGEEDLASVPLSLRGRVGGKDREGGGDGGGAVRSRWDSLLGQSVRDLVQSVDDIS